MFSSMHETWVLGGSCRAIFPRFFRDFVTTLPGSMLKSGHNFQDDLKVYAL